MRLFLALKLSPEIQVELKKTIAALKALKVDVSWVKEDNLHLTLKFLGDTDKSRVKGIIPLLDQLSKDTNKFTLSLGNLGAFPEITEPKVLWADIKEGKNETIELCKKIDETLFRAAFKREEKPFNPHITLGRCKGLSNLAKLVEGLKNTILQPLSQPVKEFYLVKSELLEEGAIYKDLHTFSLKS